jgi:hypothetical protein
VPDIKLSAFDRIRFLSALITTFHTVSRINGVLKDIGFPLGHLPPSDGTPEVIWREVLYELEARPIKNGIRTLLETALKRYPSNSTWVELAKQYESELLLGEIHANQAAQARFCHVMIRAADEEERRDALEFLDAQGLGPTEIWSTNHVTLFALQDESADRVRDRLILREGLEWILIPPDGQTYLYSQLIVQGPDGRYFRFTDTPAQQTVADLGADTIAQYPGPARRTVTDRVQPNGQGIRLSPQVTLHDAGIRDGDRLRVAFEVNAGAINPLYHAEALIRVANQIRAFVDAHPDVTVCANAPELATMYELEFKETSFGPPTEPGLEPAEIEDHVVQLEFGPDFPQVAPAVFWLTPIFHPNIYPNYDCELARKSPPRRGLVCLGDLTDAYQPMLDIGQLCQTLLDVAAFRNYGLFELTGQISLDDGQYREVLRGDAFNPAAAVWVMTHQDRIHEIGGRRQRAPTSRIDTYHNVIEVYTP